MTRWKLRRGRIGQPRVYPPLPVAVAEFFQTISGRFAQVVGRHGGVNNPQLAPRRLLNIGGQLLGAFAAPDFFRFFIPDSANYSPRLYREAEGHNGTRRPMKRLS